MPKLKAYPVFLLLEAATALLFGMIFTMSALYQVQSAGLSALQLVLVGTTLELTIFLFEIPTGVVADLVRRLDTTRPNAIARIMLAASAVMVIGLITFAQARSLVLAVGMIWLIDVFRSLNRPLYTTWVNQRLDPQVRATVLSMSSQISVRAAITASGLLLAPTLGLFIRALRLPEPPASDNSSTLVAEPGEAIDLINAPSD